MKNFIIAVTGLFFITSPFQSCKKSFLDENLISAYTPTNTLTDSLGLEAAIAGLQSVVRGQYTSGDLQGLLSTMHVGTDIARVALVQGVETAFYDYPTLTSQNLAVLFYWKNAYQIINNANQIIDAVSDSQIPISEAAKNSYLAEAKFFRAYAYNFLTILWGDVPLMVKPLDNPRTDFTRTPVTEIITFTINDLTFAVAHLPEVNRVKKEGRINKSAARQLLAEVYLRAGKPDLAEAECKSIISTGLFKLINARYGIKKDVPGDYYADMFIKGNQRRREGNTEGIWIIEQDFNVPGGSTATPIFAASAQHHRNWIPFYSSVAGMIVADSLGGRGIGRMRLSNWVLYQLYSGNDMRNSIYNIKRKFWYNNPQSPDFGKPVVVAAADTIFRIAPHTTKWNYFNPLGDGTQFPNFKDLFMMRLGETYLLMAEAQFRQGKLMDAATSINALRTRAQAPQVQASDITLNFILDERARELVAEENRRMTLVRTGTLVARAQQLNASNIIGLQPFNMLLPIPQTEIDLNTGAELKQNTGYN